MQVKMVLPTGTEDHIAGLATRPEQGQNLGG